MYKKCINNKRALLFTVVLLFNFWSTIVLNGQEAPSFTNESFGTKLSALSRFSYHNADFDNGGIPYISDASKSSNATPNSFRSKQAMGVIGISERSEKEHPHDNYFTVEIPKDVDLTQYDAMLTYDLYGVESALHTSKSINHSKVYGGEAVAVNQEWKEVSEYISNLQIKSGVNEIFFNRRADAAYYYEIKNLRIDFIKKQNDQVYLADEYLKNYNGEIQITGFAPKSVESVTILNEEIDVSNGVFEHILKNVDEDIHTITVEYKMGGIQLASDPYRVEIQKNEFSFDFSGFEKSWSYELNNQNVAQYFSIEGMMDHEISDQLGSEIRIQGLEFKELRPLNSNVTNVTGGVFLGYRTNAQSKSSGQFNKLSLAYDETKIPDGYSAKDIRTFAYDSNQRVWKMLHMDSLDYVNKRIISMYNGETDYVNGIIKVPGMAETSSFTPTTVSDINYANPAAGVVSVAPPSVNYSGTATTNFPIKLPKGRNGMTPNLTVNYSSENGNGWMGLGWDVRLPGISLDTRWGAPRFDEVKETEVYLLNGQSLVQKYLEKYVVPHRSEDDILRNGPGTITKFYLRKEGSYHEIIRYGDSPGNYRWRVTDKYGVRHYYGGNSNSVEDNTVIRDASGAITYWALFQSVDPFGNYVHYKYVVEDVNVNGIQAQKFYPDWIRYTLKSGEPTSYYQVNFERNQYSVGSNASISRVDTTLNARSGALKISSDLLTEIGINYHDGQVNPVRTYRFDYSESAFKKSQLSKISEYDTEGRLFYSNTMDYYDEVGSGTIIDNNEVEWLNGNETAINSPLEVLAPLSLAGLIPGGSLLGTSTSKGFSFGLRVGAGFGKNVKKINFTAAGSFNYTKDVKKTKIELLDINGDGRPDKVYTTSNNEVKYQPNLGIDSNDNGIFGTPKDVSAISELNNLKSRTNGFGVDVKFKKIGAGVSWSRTRMAKDEYFKDFNGDGLPDMVSNNKILFNTTQEWSTPGNVSFGGNINSTNNPILSGSIHGQLLGNIELESREELRANHSQFDHVKVWKAPYDGDIIISGTATLIEKNDCGNATEPNEIRLSIERGEGDQDDYASLVLPSRILDNEGDFTDYNFSVLSVQKGEYFFFRIHNLGYGCGAEIEWNPEIIYSNTGFQNTSDENGNILLEFSSEDDFILNNGGGWSPDEDINSIVIGWNLNSSSFSAFEFSDEVRFKIERTRTQFDDQGEPQEEFTENLYWTKTLDPGTGNLNSTPMPQDFLDLPNTGPNGVEYSYSYQFYIESPSNIKWKDIDWQPTITIGNEVINPGFSCHIYDNNVNQSKYWFEHTDFATPVIDPMDANDVNSPFHRISHTLFDPVALANFLDPLDARVFPVKVNWSSKQDTNGVVQPLHTRTFYIHQINCTNNTNCDYEIRESEDPNVGLPINLLALASAHYFQFDLTKGDVQDIINTQGRIYSAFYIEGVLFGQNNPTNISLSMHPDDTSNPTYIPQELVAPFISRDDNFYGIPYRGWGQFLYNGGARFDYTDQGDPDLSTYQTFDGDIQMSALDFGISPEDVETNEQAPEPGYGDVNNNTIRYTLYELNVLDEEFENRAIQYQEDVGIDYGFNSNNQLTSTIGRFGEFNIYDLWTNFDDLLNGDPFLALRKRTFSKGRGISGDLFGQGGTLSQASSKNIVDYVDLNGDKYPDLVTDNQIQFTDMLGRLSSHIIGNGFVEGSASRDTTLGITIAGMSPNSTEKDNGKSTKTKIKGGINTSYGKSFDTKSWIDINGDGLKDKVTIYETHIGVQLNLGYEFSNEIVWGSGYGDISTNKNSGGALSGAGTFTNNDSYKVKFGLAQSFANADALLVDVNGDGLPDLLMKTSTSFVYYHNNGLGFESSPTAVFYQGVSIVRDHSVAGKLFGTITDGFSFPIWPKIFLKVTFSPSLNFKAGVNEKHISLEDMDGDGLVDIVFKGSDNGKVIAKLNKVGKTNYLKTVHTPLGGSWTIDYKKEGNTFNLPNKKYVLSKITTHDGFIGDSAFGPNETLTTVSYEKPKYDKRNREFLGFGKVKVNQDDPDSEDTYRYSLMEYHNKNVYLKGLTKKSSSHDSNGNKLTESKTLYNVMDPDVPATDLYADEQDDYLQDGVDSEFLDFSRLFVAPVKSIKTNYENGDSLSAEKQFTEYDGNGNLRVFKNLGDTYTTVAGLDAYRTEIDYYSSLPGIGNSIAFAKTVSVFAESDNQLLRKREASYFKNKLSEIRVQLNNSEIQETRIDYDDYGNVDTTTLANGYWTAITYDDQVHSYPVLATNVHGYTSSSLYDYRFGALLLSTDINEQSMRTRIDNRGRVVEVTAPKEMLGAGNDWTIRMQYEGEDILPVAFINDNYVIPALGSFVASVPGTGPSTDAKHHAVTRHYVEQAQDTQLVTINIVDGLGNPIQQKKTHFSNENNAGVLKWIISGKEKKDAFGRVTESFLPTTQSGYPSNSNNLLPIDLDYNSTINAISPLQITFDEKDRKISIRQPGEGVASESVFGIDQGMFTTMVTNEQEQTMKTYTDVSGRLRKTIQNEELTTQNYYNQIGEKVKIKNHQGYETYYRYDLAGRRIEERQPDRGVTIYEYDSIGNVVRKSTSNLLMNDSPLHIEYVYNYNQLKEVNYPNNPENNVKYIYGIADEPAAELQNAVGRLFMQEDGSGVQGFGYDETGNLINHMKGVAVAGRHTYWFQTEWVFDSQNRVKTITYPDLERVTYDYNSGGELTRVGRLIEQGGQEEDLVSLIRYNDLGEKSRVDYGNGTSCIYTYDVRRRVNSIGHDLVGFDLTNTYEYDTLSNVVEIYSNTSSSNMPGTGEIGGRIAHSYRYDKYNRLRYAEGRYTGANDNNGGLLAQEYNLEMEYDRAHNIISKKQSHVQGGVVGMTGVISTPEVMPKTNYHLNYSGYATGAMLVEGLDTEYGYVQPHGVRELMETPNISGINASDSRIKKKIFEYDANGNQISTQEVIYDLGDVPANHGVHEPDTILISKNLWDEEDRLRAVDLNPDEKSAHPVAIYTYDAAGQRIVRYVPGRLDAWSNSTNVATNERDEVMLYPSAMLSAKALTEFGVVPQENYTVTSYTKHYYIGSNKITSTLGSISDLGLFPTKATGMFPGIRAMADQQVITASDGLRSTYLQLGQNVTVPFPVAEGNIEFYVHDQERADSYWYHKDHLGSSSYITNDDGIVTQHMEYLPFGETLVDEHLNSYNTPYKFNGKELDDETGYYYYGARYYNPRMSQWLSVDPLVEQTMDSYGYVWNNPLNFIDPDGRSGQSTHVRDNGNGTYTVVGGDLNDGDKGIYVVDENSKRTGEKIGVSATMYSFYNDDAQDSEDQQGWKGTIDINSREGMDFFNSKIRNNEPGLFSYMWNATSGEKYDLKRLDENGNQISEDDPRYDDRNYHHRGSYYNTDDNGNKIYASARDFGNYAAGYIAGVNNIGWGAARFAFNGLEWFSSGANEGQQSVRAQKLGHNHGYPIGQSRASRRRALIEEMKLEYPEIFYPRGPKD
ncbi:MAG: SpvB/TcaC N-terminal domain-containing protein [Bacteroidota bacterium]